MKQSMIYLTSGLFILSLLVLACSKDSTNFETDSARIKFSIISQGGSFLGKAGITAVDNITLTSVQVVIDEIEFESTEEDSMDFELEQPFVQDLNISDTLHEVENVTVPFGSYKEMEIEIDRLKSETGQVFIDHPELQNQSIRVEGFLDGDTANTFIFLSQMEVEQEFEFEPPLLLDETSSATNVVLEVDLSLWFVDEHQQLLDPRIGANKNQIEENIRKSFRVFEDEDDDGHPDDD